jgi:hypothetical protein
MTTRDESTTSTAPTIPDQWNQIPCVQYGFPDDKGPKRAPKLRTIFEPIPEGANTASPVYVLSREQYERQQRLENGYQVKDYKMIATELQEECEVDDRVLYPVHIESDELWNYGPSPLIKWFREFVEDYLEVPFHTCKLYFSGNRSIHVHTPRLISGEEERERFKELAKTFCEETSAELDCALYEPKRLFRIPGIEHEDTGVPKLEINGDWDDSQMAHKVEKATADVPHSYAEVLQDVFVSQESLTVSSPQSPLDDPLALFRVLDSDKTVLELGTGQQDIDTPLIEQEEYPDNPAQAIRWLQYNDKEFSPYAFAEGQSRSVAALKVKNGAFAKEKKRDGATMIPAWFYGAVGASGEFTKEREHAPLQLSKRDYKKWDAQPNDTVVIIGGRSRNSKILDVNGWQACVVGHALTSENGGRDTAFDYLEAEGYDIGSAGSPASSSSSSSDTTTSTSEAKHIWPARENPQSGAEAFQRQAEQNGIETLSHPERIKVACRVLRYGWKPAWDWFKEQFGPEFKPLVTWTFFKNIVEEKSFEEYEEVKVPDKPT